MPDTAENATPLGYRPSLDGVRALAVLFVVGVHTRPRFIPAGSFGVDVFFVLSGFLITTLLVEELDDCGRLSIGRFYARRALRLFPALFGLLGTVTVWALLVASPGTRHHALEEVLAAASYTRNLSWWSHVPGTMLGHTWSLAVEEQFYLLWPLVLTMAVRARRSASTLTVAFIVVFALSSVLRLSGVAGPGTLFFGRPEALLLGAALALARRDHPQVWTGPAALRRARGAAITGAVALVVLDVWDGADGLFSIGFTMAALSAALLIYGLVVLDGRGPGAVFAWGPAVALGRVSYGLYLWHLPILRWTDDHLIGRPAVVRLGVALSLSMIATLASYRLLEQPALRLKRRLSGSASRPAGTVATPTVTSPASR